jgi:hypothetical protein
MKPLICNRFFPALNECWKLVKGEFNSHWSNTLLPNIALGLDMLLTVGFFVISTVGLSGTFGETLQWFGIINVARVFLILFVGIFISALWTDRKAIPLAEAVSENTTIIYTILWFGVHAIIFGIWIATSQTEPIHRGIGLLMFGLCLSKIINIMHPNEFDLLDAIQWTLRLPKKLINF